jgi:hypothetical protein
VFGRCELCTNGIERGFGGSAESVMLLSPHRLLPGEIDFRKCHSTSFQDTEDYHLLMNMVEAAKSNEQKLRMRKLVSHFTAQCLAENRNTAVSSDETTFLGEDDSKGYRSGKRHKQQHEKWSRKRK